MLVGMDGIPGIEGMHPQQPPQGQPPQGQPPQPPQPPQPGMSVKMLLSTFHPKNWNKLEECTVNCNILHYHAKSWKHIQ
jgi:hypothetical protein